MKVNVWSINYKPELIGIAFYNTELCKYLIGKGHEVTVVTGMPYYPDWRIKQEYAGKVWQTELLDGVKVLRNWLYVPAHPTVLTRILHEFSFVCLSTIRQLLLPAPDVYFIVSPPLLLGLAASFVAFVKRRPFIFHIQDLQPGTALELSMLKSALLKRILLVVEALSYKYAARVSACTKAICDVLTGTKNLPQSKVRFVPNWVELPAAVPEHGDWKTHHGVEHKRPLVTYSGNIGVKQGIDAIVEAARQLQDTSDALFVIAGNGARKEELQQLLDRFKVKNVITAGVLSEDEHTQLLLDSKVCLITQKPGAGWGFFPSKLLKILAYERAVVTNAEVGSPLFDAVQEGNFGLCAPPGRDNTLGQAIAELLSNPGAVERMGKSGREYVKRFDSRRVLPEVENMLREVIPDGCGR